MKYLPLSQGRFALVDDEDFDRLSQFPWFYKAEASGRQGAAMRRPTVNGAQVTEYLTRAVLQPPADRKVIHLNKDRLDCRKCNLQIADKAHVQRQAGVRYDSSSGIKGVKYDGKRDLWQATMYRDDKEFVIGRFNTAAEADRAFQAAVLRWEYIEANNLPRRLDR